MLQMFILINYVTLSKVLKYICKMCEHKFDMSQHMGACSRSLSCMCMCVCVCVCVCAICRNTWVHVPGVYLNQLRHVEQGAEILRQARGERLGFWRAFETETAGFESCLAHTWVMSHSYISHVSVIHESCRTHTLETCFTRTHESCLTHSWVISTVIWVMSHSHTWVMSHSHMSHVSLTHESCLTHTWVMSHSHMSHVSLTHHESCRMRQSVTHMNEEVMPQ